MHGKQCNLGAHEDKVVQSHMVTSDGRNQIAIRFNRDLNRNEDSIQTLRDSSTMRFDTDSIQILTIRFKRHAI